MFVCLVVALFIYTLNLEVKEIFARIVGWPGGGVGGGFDLF